MLWIPLPWVQMQEVQCHFSMTKPTQLSPCVRSQFWGLCEEICGNQVLTVHGKLARLDSNRYLEVSLCIFVSGISSLSPARLEERCGFYMLFSRIRCCLWRSSCRWEWKGWVLFFLVSPHWNKGPVRHRSCAAGEESCEMLPPSSLWPSAG